MGAKNRTFWNSLHALIHVGDASTCTYVLAKLLEEDWIDFSLL